MKHVCLLQSLTRPDQRYIGLTADIHKRLASKWSFRKSA
jgi:hypothetical protein